MEITRNFIQFSGFAIDPRLQFTAFLFSSTALNDTVYLGWINYRFSDAFDLRVGNWIVPGTREWFESFRYTLGADRLMATTFFRPNISPGIWAQGEPIKGLNYVAMFANSLNRFSQGVERVGSAPTFGGTVWWGRGATSVQGRPTSRITRSSLRGSAPTWPSRTSGTRGSPTGMLDWRIPRTPSSGFRMVHRSSARRTGAGCRAHLDRNTTLDDRCGVQVSRREPLGRILLALAR